MDCLRILSESIELLDEASLDVARLYAAAERDPTMGPRQARRQSAESAAALFVKLARLRQFMVDAQAHMAGQETSGDRASRIQEQRDAEERDYVRRRGPMALASCEASCEGGGLDRCA